MRQHLGREQPVQVPEGYGGIIGKMIVTGSRPREIGPTDLVYNYDSEEWSILQCGNFQPVHIPLHRLQRVIGRNGTLFMRLWKVPHALKDRLLNELGHAN
jgi:hypothetical protein